MTEERDKAAQMGFLQRLVALDVKVEEIFQVLTHAAAALRLQSRRLSLETRRRAVDFRSAGAAGGERLVAPTPATPVFHRACGWVRARETQGERF